MGSVSLRTAALLLLLACGLPGIANADEHCHVAAARDTLPADKAYLAGKFEDAEGLYREAASQTPHDAELDTGLVRTLLREHKLDEASSTAQAAVAAKPDSVSLLTALAEVQYRQGKVAEAAGTADQAFRTDRCYGRLYLLRGRILRLNSMYASANRAIGIAHQLDPWDSEIRGAWVQTLPLEKRVEEQKKFLDAPTGIDSAERISAEKYLSYLLAEASNPGKNCHLASPTASAELRRTLIPYGAVTGRPAALWVGGCTFFSTVEKANWKWTRRFGTIGRQDSGGPGRTEAGRASPFGEAWEIKAGKAGTRRRWIRSRWEGWSFAIAWWRVTDRKDVIGTDGLIGTDVFSSYLVTLDYPMRKFSLAPLPPRPGDDSASQR